MLSVLFGPWDTAVAADSASVDTRPPVAPDIREDETELKLQRGNLVVVPIPISNPTLETGLVAGAAWFYGQSPEQAAEQPASLTAAAGLYTSNDSRALILGQQNYWSGNRWRFTGAVGAADLNLTLPVPGDSGQETETDWQVEGAFVFAKVARRFAGDWYGGGQLRAIDADQAFGEAQPDDGFDVDASINTAGIGLLVEYDNRDMPINSYSGRYFKLDVLFNYDVLGGDSTYQNYSATLRAYRELRTGLVFAWEARACNRSGQAPLWDACTIPLRGFSATDYLGKVSAAGQAEIRWQVSPRWGAVGFAGAGFTARAFNERGEDDTIPSYGAGIRFMVLPAKRVNLRVDFARSKDSDAIHVSVGEAF
ncbi:MAG TPA: hypothetical protein VFY03_04685 [Woeseiaceae bacterium]|nr:hypothetical protein [Woeseiaceae bacterium]